MSTLGLLRIALRPSSLISGALALAHAATSVLLWSAALLPDWAMLGTLAGIAIHGCWAVRRFGVLRDFRSIVAVEVGLGPACRMWRRDGTEIAGFVDPSTVVVGSLVILAVNQLGSLRCTRVIVAPDMLAADEFRRLRTALKWAAAQEPDLSQV